MNDRHLAKSAAARLGLALTLIAAASLVCARAQPMADEAAIATVLQDSADAWSRGDVAAFMQSYEDSPQTEFLTATGLVQGFATIRDHYVKKYGTGQAMGHLSLSILETRQLDPSFALVTGRFALARSKDSGGNANGVFSLLFHKSAVGWRIVYDHSS
jgi:uncharacterized protein (TIGR02246 family)